MTSLTNEGRKARFGHFYLRGIEKHSAVDACRSATTVLHPLSHATPQDHFHSCKGNEAEKSVHAHVPQGTQSDFLLL